MKLQNHITEKGGEYYFRKDIKGKQIKRKLRNESGDYCSTMTEATAAAGLLVANAILENEKAIEENKARRKRCATIGEILDRYETHPHTVVLSDTHKRNAINCLTLIVGMATDTKVELNSKIKGPSQGQKKKATKVAGSKQAAARRREKVGGFCSSILTAGLVDKVSKMMFENGPVVRDFEKDLPEHQKPRNGQLSGPLKRRIAQTIKSTFTAARSVFSERGKKTGNLIDPVDGIYCGDEDGTYPPLTLPTTLAEFKKRRTMEGQLGFKQYRVPKRRELAKLWGGLPDLKKESPEAYKLFKLAVETGMRMRELKFALWDNFDETTKGIKYTIIDSKNGDDRTVPVGDKLYYELVDMETDPVYVIGAPDGVNAHSFREWTVEKQVSAYMRKCGWTRRMCAHEMRKWFGAMVADETKDLNTVMHALGHRSWQTTKFTYSGIVNPLEYSSFTETLPGSAGNQMEKVA